MKVKSALLCDWPIFWRYFRLRLAFWPVDLTKQAVRETTTICLRPCKSTFDLLISKAVSESRVTWDTYVPILVFLGLSVLDLGPMYATD